MATHSGKLIKWDDAFNSDLSLSPAAYTWDAEPPVLPDANGNYPIPMPGTTEVL